MIQLGIRPNQLPAFNVANIANVPRESGVYIIFEPAGAFYVGRSGVDIRRRLFAHLTGTGSQNVKLARKINEVAASLTFTYALIPRVNQREVESYLIAALGTARLANMRREGLYEEQLQD
jgi:predicted GIY-YIG superfamily endonuclease